MKKSTIILAFLLTAATGYTFANGTTGNNETTGTKEIKTTIRVDSARATNLAATANDGNAASGNTIIGNAGIENTAIGSRVSLSFKQDFTNAELINSEIRTHFTKLTFRMNGMILQAFYTDKGELIATIHNMLSSQLPISLLMDLKKNYRGYWITELFELNGKGQNAYYISLENADTNLALQSTEDNAWKVYQKTEKK